MWICEGEIGGGIYKKLREEIEGRKRRRGEKRKKIKIKKCNLFVKENKGPLLRFSKSLIYGWGRSAEERAGVPLSFLLVVGTWFGRVLVMEDSYYLLRVLQILS